MRRAQVFVRAQRPDGRWASVDALDLDEASFRAFVLDCLRRVGAVVALSDAVAEGEEVVLRCREGAM